MTPPLRARIRRYFFGTKRNTWAETNEHSLYIYHRALAGGKTQIEAYKDYRHNMITNDHVPVPKERMQVYG